MFRSIVLTLALCLPIRILEFPPLLSKGAQIEFPPPLSKGEGRGGVVVMDTTHPHNPLPFAKGRGTVRPAPVYNPLQILGIRPGIGIDSIQRIMKDAEVTLREVQQDTLTHCFADQSIHIYVVDSIICRLTYMRMSFLVDDKNRLRRFTITPRESSIAVGATDDIEDVLLLYFGQTWGKPELNLDPPLPNFKWRTGNIEVRGFIKRGYPIWVMEG